MEAIYDWPPDQLLSVAREFDVVGSYNTFAQVTPPPPFPFPCTRALPFRPAPLHVGGATIERKGDEAVSVGHAWLVVSLSFGARRHISTARDTGAR